MQILKVKKPGSNTSTKVRVLRSWANAKGTTIYLHHNGVYGYKDGAPVRSESELLDGIHAPVQQAIAVRWWRSIGQRLAEDYYAARMQTEMAASSDFQMLDDGANSALDMTMYRRRCVKPGSAVSGPKSWMETGFPERPDWWGQARMIEVGEWVYERVDELVDEKDTIPLSSLTPPLASLNGAGSGGDTGA